MKICFLRAVIILSASLTISLQPVAAQDASKCKLSRIAKLPVIMEGPRASVTVSFNGSPSRIWLDSGSFFNFMPKAKAVELGLRTEPLPLGYYMSGIGGKVTPQLTRVRKFGVAGVVLDNMEFLVGGSDGGNGFLGANFINLADAEFDFNKGEFSLFKEVGCKGVSLAYWASGMAVGEARILNGRDERDNHIGVEVIVNGTSLHAMLDTGAPTSIINRRAAARAGIDINAPKVVASEAMTGIGSRHRQSWIARAKLISIGGEEIRNSPVRIIDDTGDDDGYDMLLGVDFLMSHHVLISKPQHKMFLTYSGGPIFSSTTDQEIGFIATVAKNMGASENAHEPTTAEEFAGRASGRLTRGDVVGSIGDFSSAIKLAPHRADLLSDRAGAYLQAHQFELAEKDIYLALTLSPNQFRLLARRAEIKFDRGDRIGALADIQSAAALTPKGSLDVLPIINLYERMGMADQGLALIDPVVALHRSDSNYGELLNSRSWIRALANSNLDQALNDANAAIRLSGPVPAILDTRALIQFRRKNYTAAIADDDAVIATEPDHASARFVRGLARLATGDAAGAEADIAAARNARSDIDQFYAHYGLVAPKAAAAKSESPAKALPLNSPEKAPLPPSSPASPPSRPI